MRRLSNMNRNELESEAREAWDLMTYKASTALSDIDEDMLKSLLKASRAGTFDPTPYFDRNGRKWTAKIDEMKEAFLNATATKKKKTRAGWTEERRQKTMATRAAKKAAREKEVADLKAEIDRLTLELVESEALVVKQAEELEQLRRAGPTGTAASGVAIGQEQSAMLSQVFEMLSGMFKTEAASVEEVQTSVQEEEAATLKYVVESNDDLTTMSVYQLNKKATDLGVSPDMNRERLIARIKAAENRA